MDTAGQVFWAANSEVEMSVEKLVRECSGDEHPWKGNEGSRTGQGEQAGCDDTASAEASADLQGVLKMDDPSELS